MVRSIGCNPAAGAATEPIQRTLQMKNSTVLIALIAGIGLSACEKPTVVAVPVEPIVVQGQPGPRGPMGMQGSQGNQGNTGYQGADGSQGAQGYQGNQGESGATGMQGHQGMQGNQGNQGNRGLKGDTGSAAPLMERVACAGTTSDAALERVAMELRNAGCAVVDCARAGRLCWLANVCAGPRCREAATGSN